MTEAYIANAGFNPSSPISNLRQGREGSIAEQVMNATLLQRGAQIKKLLDPRRDIDDECGFPKNHELTMAQYQYLYDREAVATRVVEVLPDESWKVQPTIFEVQDIDTETEFEKGWNELSRSMRSGDGEKSWFGGKQNQEGSSIWEYLHRIDKLSGIGAFGCILLGLDDGVDLRKPVIKGQHKLLSIRVFGESQVDIRRLVNDKSSPRNGRPEEYHITLSDPDEDATDSVGTMLGDIDVHWSRVIHIADMLGSSELFAVPRLRPVLNNVLNLRKLYGGSAEMYWQGAFPGLGFVTHPQLGTDVTVDQSSLRSAMTNYSAGLQRYVQATGMDIKSLAPQVVDPSKQIDVQLEAICIKLAIPKRIFLGSERGELSSSQDSSTWNTRIKHRQSMYLTPRVIVPFIDRLINLGILPEPKDGYSVDWPEIEQQDEVKKADVSLKKTQALTTYVQGSGENLIHPKDYLVRVLGMSSEEADEVIKSIDPDVFPDDEDD